MPVGRSARRASTGTQRAAIGRVLQDMSGMIGFELRFAYVTTGFTIRLYVSASHGRETHHTAARF